MADENASFVLRIRTTINFAEVASHGANSGATFHLSALSSHQETLSLRSWEGVCRTSLCRWSKVSGWSAAAI